jgi:TPR repeat protein
VHRRHSCGLRRRNGRRRRGAPEYLCSRSICDGRPGRRLGPEWRQKRPKWYYLAAVQGQGFAQFELGLAYNKGQGVRRDYILSYMWLNLSTSQAVGDDRDFKSRIRDAVAAKLTVAQLAYAQEISLTWYNAR